MKRLKVTFSNGEIFYIPAMIIAEDRAKYHAKLDSERGDGEYDEVYKLEIEYALSDTFEIIDWANNNMNWSDLVEHARLIDTIPADYEREWSNAKKVVEDD